MDKKFFQYNTVLSLVTVILGVTLITSVAVAHSFKVILVLPAPIDTSLQARELRNGFMLATTERDSHPDEESDGHLGGLDVYVSVIDEQGATAGFERSVVQGAVDIVALFGVPKNLPLINKILKEKNVALLLPGQSPFASSGLPEVAAFTTAYEARYGNKPSSSAAQGYNAARRIGLAVRAQGGADDITLLRGNFGETARDFSW